MSIVFDLIWLILAPVLSTIDEVNSKANQQGGNGVENEWMTTALILQGFFASCGVTIRLYGQIFQLYVTRTIALNLGSICATREECQLVLYCTSASTLCPNKQLLASGHEKLIFDFKSAVEKFLKMRSIIKRYNSINCWAILSYKALALLGSTLMLYYPSRKERNEREMSNLTCHLCVMAILQRLFVQLYSMGQVYSYSEKFGISWKAELAWRNELTSRNLAVLEVCSAFGFEVGHFYVITPSTLLMFCSVLLSYVIFVYQI